MRFEIQFDWHFGFFLIGMCSSLRLSVSAVQSGLKTKKARAPDRPVAGFDLIPLISGRHLHPVGKHWQTSLASATRVFQQLSRIPFNCHCEGQYTGVPRGVKSAGTENKAEGRKQNEAGQA